MNTSRNYLKGDYDRADHDYYVDPSWVSDALADTIPFVGIIWDPACGSGTIPEVFRARGYQTWASDIVDRGYSEQNSVQNFLEVPAALMDPNAGTFNIVTNPPFNLSVQFVRHAMAMPNTDRVAIIAQIKFLASQQRHALFTEYPPTDVLILSRRPSMPPGHLIEEMGDKAFKGGQMDYCVICFRQGHNGTSQIRWLNPVL